MPTANNEDITPISQPPAPSRRALLGASAALIVGGAIATTANAAPAGADAELIRVCHRFAESQFDDWYRYVTAPIETADDDAAAPDWNTYHWIVGTPATTPAGWRAKALAFTSWDREAYDDHKDSRDPATTFLSAVLRDLVAPERNAIVASLRSKYGPLPSTYSPDGVWIGLPEEEKEAGAAAHEAKVAARMAEDEAAMAEVSRRHNIKTMTREELEESIAGFEALRDIAEKSRKRAVEQLAGVVA